MDQTRQAADVAVPAGRAAAGTGGRPVQAELTIFTWKLLITAVIFGLLFLAWRVADALLLIFTGVLLAILLQRIAGWVHRVTRLPHGWALSLVIVVLAVAVLGIGYTLGQSMAAQFHQFADRISGAVERLPGPLREQIADQGRDASSWLSRLQTVASGVLFFLGDTVIVLFSAIYLAASPGVYRRGVILLVPPRGHQRAHEVLDVTGDALWRWLIGQLAAMAIVGLLVTGGLYLLGIPSALALGILAGLLEFIPLIGPVLAAVPAILIAFGQSPTDAVWVALLYLLIQQIEGNLITPLLQKRVVDLPPVITIGAIAAGGLLFGLLGMFLATPLAVVALVLVNMLYIEGKLEQRRHFPREDG